MFFIYAFWVLVLGGIGCYNYFFLRRLLRTLGFENRKAKVGLWVAVLVLTALCANPFGSTVVVVMHIMFFGLLVRLLHRIIGKCVKNKDKKAFFVWTKVYGTGIVPVLMTFALLLFGYIQLNNVVATHYDIDTQKAIRAEGYRVALVADVHFGVSLDEEELWEKCREIEAKEPDIVILCGDIVDNSTTQAGMRTVFEALGSIESEFGIYYVYGNHDRPMSVVKSPFTEEQLNEAITASGITILQDETLSLTEDFWLVGREDRSHRGRKPLEALLESAERDDFVLVLDHQPNDYAANAALGVDLVLSGHTHGGQLFPINYLQEWIPFNDGVYGRYQIGKDSVAIVTAGFGTWNYKTKTAAPAEYVIIDIQKS